MAVPLDAYAVEVLGYLLRVASTPHIPVLPTETLASLALKPGQIAVDCTLGLGGHSSMILKTLQPGGKLIAIDFDPANIARAQPRLSLISPNFQIFHNNFAALPTVLQQAGIEKVDAVLADVGVASTQIDDPERGFSYRRPGPLDMRMDPTRGQPASSILARISQRDLAEALRELGDEDDADAIAALVVEKRKLAPIDTTEALTAIVCQARDFTLERAAGAKLHPAARTFQALRILTNRELANLDRLLAVLPTILNPGGRAAIISFHSGEDRRVKLTFKEGLRAGTYDDISDEPIMATEAEIRSNPRSRSAKLRWAKRT